MDNVQSRVLVLTQARVRQLCSVKKDNVDNSKFLEMFSFFFATYFFLSFFSKHCEIGSFFEEHIGRKNMYIPWYFDLIVFLFIFNYISEG